MTGFSGAGAVEFGKVECIGGIVFEVGLGVIGSG